MICNEEIKRLYFEEKLSMNQVAEKLNCSRGTIHKRFKKAGLKARGSKECRRYPHPLAKLTAAEVLSIRKEFVEIFREGEPVSHTLVHLAEKYNSSSSNIRSILHRKSWKNI